VKAAQSAASGAYAYAASTGSALQTIGRSDSGDFLLGQRAVDLISLFALRRLPAAPEVVGATDTGIPQVLLNKAAGDAFRDSVAAAMQQAGYDVKTEVYKSTGLGARYIDVDVSKNGVTLGGIETKVGSSVYTTRQSAKDAWSRYTTGYIVSVLRDEGQ
jgi:hypothetical protein